MLFSALNGVLENGKGVVGSPGKVLDFLFKKGYEPCKGIYGEASPKKDTFSGVSYMKGWGFHKLKYIKG